jgi:hypothetical protein
MKKTTMKIDLVYVLGSGSNWHNNELRFSLRSVARNLENVGNIFIVGDKPKWIKNITHIPCEDPFKLNPDANIITKVIEACKNEELSEKFLFMNDDYFVINKTDATTIPAIHKGDMATFGPDYFRKVTWRRNLLRTRDILIEKGYTAYHFDGHLPIIINKKLFPEIIAQFDYQKNCYTMKSLYANVAYKDFIHIGKIKKIVFRPHTKAMLDQAAAESIFMAVNDQGLTMDFKQWIYSQFTEASKYEDKAETQQLAALKWLSHQPDIESGLKLYKKYGNSRNVLMYFHKHRRNLPIGILIRHIKKLL